MQIKESLGKTEESGPLIDSCSHSVYLELDLCASKINYLGIFLYVVILDSHWCMKQIKFGSHPILNAKSLSKLGKRTGSGIKQTYLLFDLRQGS